ncbi:hypothetical protein EYF80_066544 [Liparis tanakae]|uniref:Uncharacterized protein n=1 Tax=Liparis tanakae TaxID=230148 RepID=A0A4Z2E3P1_9TELE|nr:hypothetical protein EYF80_066544 [Liparis tanakae]
MDPDTRRVRHNEKNTSHTTRTSTEVYSQRGQKLRPVEEESLFKLGVLRANRRPSCSASLLGSALWRELPPVLTLAPFGPGNPITPGCPRAPRGPGGPGRPSSPAAPCQGHQLSGFGG